MRKFFFTILLSFLAVFSFAQQQYEDVVYLKNGSVIYGMIIEQIPNESIKIQTADRNIFVFKMEEITKISKEAAPTQTSSTTNSNSKKSSVTSTGFFSDKGLFFLGFASTIMGGEGNVLGFGFSSSKDKSSNGDSDPIKTTAFNISPKFGYFIIDGLVVGVNLNVGTSSTKYPDDQYYTDRKSSSTSFQIGPFARYYFQVPVVQPFVEIEQSFGSLNYEYRHVYDNSFEQNKSSYSVSLFFIGAGVALPIGNRAAIEALVGYNSTVFKEKEDNTNDIRTVDSAIGLKVGFVLSLGKK